jgi:hypothetical protein
MAADASIFKNAVIDSSIARFKNVLEFDPTCHSGIPSVAVVNRYQMLILEENYT